MTGVQTCALPIYHEEGEPFKAAHSLAISLRIVVARFHHERIKDSDGERVGGTFSRESVCGMCHENAYQSAAAAPAAVVTARPGASPIHFHYQ